MKMKMLRGTNVLPINRSASISYLVKDVHCVLLEQTKHPTPVLYFSYDIERIYALKNGFLREIYLDRRIAPRWRKR